MGLKVEWIDKTLVEIAAEREHFTLLQEAWNLKKKMEQLDCENEEDVRRLGEIDLELVYKE